MQLLTESYQNGWQWRSGAISFFLIFCYRHLPCYLNGILNAKCDIVNFTECHVWIYGIPFVCLFVCLAFLLSILTFVKFSSFALTLTRSFILIFVHFHCMMRLWTVSSSIAFSIQFALHLFNTYVWLFHFFEKNSFMIA